MAAISVNFLAHNVVGNLREDYIQIPSSNTDTTPIITTRLKKVLGIEIQAVNSAMDGTSEAIVLSGATITSVVGASQEYRILAWGW